MVAVKRDLKTLPIKSFVWNREKGELTAEASDLGPARDGFWWLQRLYDDACDVGIVIQSTTGREEAFYLTKEVEDGEGELGWLEFRPVNVRCAAKRVLIFND